MEIEIPDNLGTIQDNYPFPAPFILSSMERFKCMNDPAKIVFVKRRHLEENLKVIEQSIGMDEAERKKFLDYWCCARGTEIRAEGDNYFDLRQRAESWMERAKQKSKPQQQSRAEQYAESARQFLGKRQQDVPRAGGQPSAGGYANLPDDQ